MHSADGWRDVLVNIVFEDGVVAEIQLRLRELHKVSEAVPYAHHWWRCLERAERAGHKGPVQQQLPQGLGTQLLASGELYRGDFERGKRHGLGVRPEQRRREAARPRLLVVAGALHVVPRVRSAVGAADVGPEPRVRGAHAQHGDAQAGRRGFHRRRHAALSSTKGTAEHSQQE